MDEQKNKIAHLSFIEDNISKMAQYCVNLKGWLVAILVGLFALTINSTIDRWILFGVSRDGVANNRFIGCLVGSLF